MRNVRSSPLLAAATQCYVGGGQDTHLAAMENKTIIVNNNSIISRLLRKEEEREKCAKCERRKKNSSHLTNCSSLLGVKLEECGLVRQLSRTCVTKSTSSPSAIGRLTHSYHNGRVSNVRESGNDAILRCEERSSGGRGGEDVNYLFSFFSLARNKNSEFAFVFSINIMYAKKKRRRLRQ